MLTEYLKYFGLSEPPFDLAPDPRFFYANRATQEAFLALRYGIKLRSGLIVVTGESGTGKTTLIRMIKDRCESNIQIGAISSSNLEPASLLTQLMCALGISDTSAGRHAAVEDLKNYLIQQLAQDRIVAVVVEDAQELELDSLQQLEVLSKLRADDKQLLQLILVGRPELERNLKNPALESFTRNIALWCRVESLQTNEVGGYINHRVACSGNSPAELFQLGAIERIAAYSKGNPGLINIISAKALFSAYSASSDQINAGTVERVWQTLQRTGETEFEVAALMSEIRHHSRSTETADRDKPNPWRRSAARWVGWPASLAVLFAAGMFYTEIDKDPRSYDIQRALKQTKSQQATEIPEKSEVVPLADFRSAELPEVPNVAALPTEPQLSPVLPEAALPERSIEKQRFVREPAIQRVSSSEEMGSPRNVQSVRTVYVHTSEGRDRSIIEAIGNVLKVDGYNVRDARFSRNPTRGDVRFFFPRDRSDAERVRSLVQSELGKRGNNISLQLLERDGRNFENAAPGKIEVWLPPLGNNMQRMG